MMFFNSDSSENLPENAIILWKKFDDAWENLAKSVSEPDMLYELLYDITENPLCAAVTGALCVVLGFKLFAYLVSIFRARS